MKAARQSDPRAILLFLLLTFGTSWVSAWALHGVLGAQARDGIVTRLFTASWMYALTMGWQPLVARWLVRSIFRHSPGLDEALRPAELRCIGLGAVLALALCAAAALLAWLLAGGGPSALLSLEQMPEPQLSALPPTWELAVVLLLVFVGTVACVWFQALSEELAWRGYFLAHTMALIGPWRGLWLHGVIWGLWYAPVLMFASGQEERELLPAATFVVSCMFLGVLLAWFRLASRSIVPVVVANVTVTLAAGLPYAIHGIDPGLRGALFGPAGWLVMALVAAGAACTGLRDAIKVPRLPRRQAPMLRVATADGRILH